MRKLRKEIDVRIRVARRKLLSPEEEQRLLLDIKSGDSAAIRRLVESYEYVILKILKELAIHESKLDETLNYVKAALTRLATTELNSNEPEAFPRFAYWWIIGAAHDFLSNNKTDMNWK